MTFQDKHKVAVVTEDGKVLAEHFGPAPLFVVYTVKKGKILDKELRVNTRERSRDLEDTQAVCWELMEDLLPDVRVVICRGMGENAYVGLLRRNVLPITTDIIEAEEAVHAYLHDRLEDDPRRVHRPPQSKQWKGADEAVRIRIMKGDASNFDST
jgi:predicted Fe-Mo cluster-binding NifX family protein